MFYANAGYQLAIWRRASVAAYCNSASNQISHTAVHNSTNKSFTEPPRLKTWLKREKPSRNKYCRWHHVKAPHVTGNQISRLHFCTHSLLRSTNKLLQKVVGWHNLFIVGKESPPTLRFFKWCQDNSMNLTLSLAKHAPYSEMS